MPLVHWQSRTGPVHPIKFDGRQGRAVPAEAPGPQAAVPGHNGLALAR
jgi:hypothetical protein